MCVFQLCRALSSVSVDHQKLNATLEKVAVYHEPKVCAVGSLFVCMLLYVMKYLHPCPVVTLKELRIIINCIGYLTWIL